FYWSVTSFRRTDRARSRAEDALGHNYALLNAVVEGASEAVFVKDLAGRYVLANQITAQTLQKPREEILGKDDTAFLESDIARALMQTDQEIIRSGQSETLEESITDRMGQHRTFLSTKSPWRNDQGDIL